MAKDATPHAVLEEIAAHARGDDLARLVHTVAFAAADERRTSLADGLGELADRAGITAKDAETRHGNVLRALERGGAEAAGSATRALLAGLLARGVALSPPEGADAEGRVAEALVWLATHTSVDALTAVDEALGDAASGLWLSVAGLVRKVDAGSAPLLGRAGALIAAAALRGSMSETALTEAKALAGEVRDPIVRALLASASPGAEAPVEEVVITGEQVAPPRSAVMLVLLGLTGVLAVLHTGRLVGRVALRYRRPAELRMSARGVTLRGRTELGGRTLRERETHLPLEALLRVTREVRYPRLGLYTALLTLALGSYYGVKYMIDGLRAGAPEYLGVGVAIVMLGLGLDYLLENATSGARGRCRVVIVPRKGPALALADVDPAVADAALGKLAGR